MKCKLHFHVALLSHGKHYLVPGTLGLVNAKMNKDLSFKEIVGETSKNTSKGNDSITDVCVKSCGSREEGALSC